MRFFNIIAGIITFLSAVSFAYKSKCGPRYGKCDSGYCCSQYNYCGKDDDYCSISKGCQSRYGICAAVNKFGYQSSSFKKRCGRKYGSCDYGYCCSKSNYCGKEDTYCSIRKGCQSKYGICFDYDNPTDQTTNQPVDNPTDQPTNQPVDNPTDISVDNAVYAGFRFSVGGVSDVFDDNIPSPSEWVSMVKKFASNLNNAKPALIAIVSHNVKNKYTKFQFKKPQGVSNSSYIYYSDYDAFEDILTAFDKENFNVWLQVEPGNNDLKNLAYITFKQYGHHSCVKGFGIDLEWWYSQCDECDGKALSDSDAESLVTYIRSINPNYTVFAKHWESKFMPPTYRDHMIFVNDGQGFDNKDHMIDVFRKWAKKFSEIPVMFQIGYEDDRSIWKGNEFSIANELSKEVSKYNSNVGIFWVDFTMGEVINI